MELNRRVMKADYHGAVIKGKKITDYGSTFEANSVDYLSSQ